MFHTEWLLTVWNIKMHIRVFKLALSYGGDCPPLNGGGGFWLFWWGGMGGLFFSQQIVCEKYTSIFITVLCVNIPIIVIYNALLVKWLFKYALFNFPQGKILKNGVIFLKKICLRRTGSPHPVARDSCLVRYRRRRPSWLGGVPGDVGIPLTA